MVAMLCYLIGHKWVYKKYWNASQDWGSDNKYRVCLRCHKVQNKFRQYWFADEWKNIRQIKKKDFFHG